MTEPEQFHPLLRRQVKKYLPVPWINSEMAPFLSAVNETYLSNDQDRTLLEHSLEVSSEELLQKNSESRAIFQAFPDVFLRIHASGRILDYKAGSLNMAQLFSNQLIGKYIQDIASFRIDLNMIKRVCGTMEVIIFEHSLPTETKTVYLETRIKSLLSDQAIIIIRDITERIIAQEKLPFNALHDALTLLPNRTLLYDRLMNFIKRHVRNPSYNFAVLFIDFDRFKIINDSLGHQTGDALLIDIGQRILDTLRGVDIAARFGGDEFCVILDEVQNEEDVTQMISRMQKNMALPFYAGKKEIFLTMSIGIVISSSQERTADEYIRDADLAMYNAKNNGKAQFMFFNKEMHRQAVKIMDLEGDLHKAVINNELELYYQPIVSLKSKAVMRLEALVRWNHPAKGLIPPNEFISQAEQTGLILKIGEYVLNRACDDCKRWQQQGFANVAVAVNCSAMQFRHINFLDLIRGALQKAQLDPRYLEIEITETVAMNNIEFTLNILQKLREINVVVAIDDFGTGYSSLSSLIEFPIDSLKIDRKFVKDLGNSKSSHSLTLAIISLAHSLGLKVVGEGIETVDQLGLLTASQCDEGQGYLFSKPKPYDQIIPVLRDLKY